MAVTVSDPGGTSSTASHAVQVTGEDRAAGDLSPLHDLMPPSSGPSAVADLAVRPTAVPVQHHALRLRMRCRGANVCHGYLRAVALVGHGTHEHALLLSHRRFSILRGGRLVHLRLRRSARRRLHAHPRVRVTAYLGGVGDAHVWAASIYRVHRG